MTGTPVADPPSALDRQRSRWRARLRFLWLVIHLLIGMLAVALGFPFISRARRQGLTVSWSARLLAIVGLRLRIVGTPVDGALRVANHISWLDIFAINAVCPSGFVAKAEIRRWPLVGWLCEKTDTLFIERGRARHAQHVAHRMADFLREGRAVTVFPEGTTSAGRDVLPFHAALLQPAISVACAVQPLALRYRDGDGQYSKAPAYIDELSFLDTTFNVLSERGLTVEVVMLPPLLAHSERRSLAAAAEAAIGEVVRRP